MTAEQEVNAASEGFFERLADWMSYTIGRPGAFILALAIIASWASFGPVAGFSNTWQLVVNSFTTIATFLMVFLLGNASNRITENQDRMLGDIFDEEQRVKEEEDMIRKILDRIDARHIRPILKHLDEQDRQIEAVADRVLAAIERSGGSGL
jgi:low affinity Fe/Cu permease